MRQLYKPTVLLVTAGIGLGLATIGASLTLAALIPVTTRTPKMSNSPVLLAQGLNKDELLKAHNQYRKDVGVLPLKWSDSLASSAQKWADRLASTDSFKHSSTQYGENIWAGTSEAYSQTQMVNSWGKERQYFVANRAFPRACTGDWSQCAHYTQIIWKDTQQVGCGLATSKNTKTDYLVCQYNPPGNIQGRKPY